MMADLKFNHFKIPHKGSVVGSHVQGLYSSVSNFSASSLSISNPYTSAFPSIRSGCTDFGSGTRSCSASVLYLGMRRRAYHL